jgi:hypothetical protein
LYKEKVNWWWFLLIGEIIVLVLFSINKYVPLLDNIIFRQYFIVGLNPFVPLVFNFFLLFFMSIAFKISHSFQGKSNAGLIIYLILGLITTALLLPIHILDPFNSVGIYPRRYVDVTNDSTNSGAFYLVWSYFLAALFLFFYIKNFPKKI